MVNKKNLFCLYCLSIMPMIMNQYGFSRTAGAITGFINLFNPIGVFFTILFFGRVGYSFCLRHCWIASPALRSRNDVPSIKRHRERSVAIQCDYKAFLFDWITTDVAVLVMTYGEVAGCFARQRRARDDGFFGELDNGYVYLYKKERPVLEHWTFYLT